MTEPDPAAADPAVSVADHPDESRYEVTVDGAVVGLAAYRLDGDVITFTHTEVDDAHEGQGLAGRLAAFALDDARTRGLSVLPECPYIRRWIARHPAYVDLVPADARPRYDL